MDTIIRDVGEIDAADRQALEHVIGRHLSEGQRVIFRIESTANHDRGEETTQNANGLPSWFNVFDGLMDDKIVAVDAVIRQRADLTRLAE